VTSITESVNERYGDFSPTTFGLWGLRGVRTTHTISDVTRLLAAALLLLGTVSPTNLAFSEPSSKVEKITGRIVAYSSGLACLNGNGYWSMLIRVQDRTTALPPRFVQVQFSLPCAEHPEWLDRKIICAGVPSEAAARCRLGSQGIL
jgi:hypothetical protein